MAVTVVKIFAITWVISKWMVYRLSFMAVLLYYGERGMDLPSMEVIQKYRLRVVKKMLGIKTS